jgi:signal transduction histidine kinase
LAAWPDRNGAHPLLNPRKSAYPILVTATRRSFEDDVAAVQHLAILPTILDTVCRITGMGFAAVARVTEDRWIACGVEDRIAFGLKPGGELDITTTICHEIRASETPVVIDDVDSDPLYATHHTPLLYGFKSYISVPIILPSGEFFGTLCAIDPSPAHLSRPEIANTFTLFADLIGLHLATSDTLARAEARLSHEQDTSVLREQFIAVLGHDLRNPIAALVAGTTMLQSEPQSPKGTRVLGMMRDSLATMEALVNNVLDFARGRMGSGIGLDKRAVEMQPLVAQAVGEIQSAHPDREVIWEGQVDLTLQADPVRLYQLITNLLGNAVTHGAADRPIIVACSDRDGLFRLKVTNGGAEIPEEARAKLFEPFERNALGSRPGLGLGLYIASQIAEAHGGTLTLDSTPGETSFTFTMPAQ